MKLSILCCGFSCCTTEKKKLDARISQSKIGSVYDKIAPVYDVWGKLTESRARNRAIELAEIKDGSHVLEVAGGLNCPANWNNTASRWKRENIFNKCCFHLK